MQLVKGHSGALAQASDRRRAGRAASPIAPAVRSKIGQGCLIQAAPGPSPSIVWVRGSRKGDDGL